MAQRGEAFRREAKRRIIEYLIGREGASPSELAEAVGVSRVTLSILLDELVDKGVLTRQGERSYSLLSDSVAVLLRMGIESAQIITVDLCGREVRRNKMSLVPSMSYADNAARLLGIAERYASELSLDGREIYCAFIYYGKLSLRSVPKRFSFISGDELLASGLSEYSGATLYIDGADRASYLLLDGRIVASGRISELLASEMRSALGLIKPQRVILAGADEAMRASAESATVFRGAEFSFIPPSKLCPDERAALIGMIAELI
jgi:DNA-binding transcriptional ArsR family regulator